MAAHAKLSASGSPRWTVCAGSVAMELAYPDTTSVYAEEGSAAHYLAELALLSDESCDFFVGTTFTEYPEHPVTTEMAEYVQEYVDLVRHLSGRVMIPRILFVEVRVDFSPWVPEGFGTSDAVVIDEEEGICTIVDLKYGQGVRVDAEENTQALLYALGVYNDFSFLYEFSTIRMIIVQPRKDHISEWVISVDELLERGEWLKERALLTLQPDAPLTPSEKACRFCKAKGECRALAEFSLSHAVEGFEIIENDMEVKDPNRLSNRELSVILNHVDTISTWVKAIEAGAIHKAESGENIPGYKLVRGRANRKWRDEETALRMIKNARGVKVSDLTTLKLFTPTQAEKVLGKNHRIIQDLVIKPEGRLTLAPETDKRPAITVDPSEGFDIVKRKQETEK